MTHCICMGSQILENAGAPAADATERDAGVRFSTETKFANKQCPQSLSVALTKLMAPTSCTEVKKNFLLKSCSSKFLMWSLRRAFT